MPAGSARFIRHGARSALTRRSYSGAASSSSSSSSSSKSSSSRSSSSGSSSSSSSSNSSSSSSSSSRSSSKSSSSSSSSSSASSSSTSSSPTSSSSSHLRRSLSAQGFFSCSRRGLAYVAGFVVIADSAVLVKTFAGGIPPHRLRVKGSGVYAIGLDIDTPFGRRAASFGKTTCEPAPPGIDLQS